MALLGHDTFVQGASQNIAVTAASVASTAFAAQTRWIRVCLIGAAGGGCHIQPGDGTPTATATSPSLPVNWIEYITVNPGQKIAVIQDAATTGNLNITELS
jgi:hypothetical protein